MLKKHDQILSFRSFGSSVCSWVFCGSFDVDMEKNLQASQRFLKGIVSLPTFEEAKARQLKHLRGVIDKAASQSTSAVADLVASLDGSIWNSEELDSLKQALAQKISEGKERRKMQDYSAFPRYLPERIWNGLLTTSKQMDRLESLVRFCSALGMRCPSEPTIAGLVWLSTCGLRMQEISESEKISALRESKPNIKRWLANLPDPALYLQVLPTNVSDCPQPLIEHAFPQGFQEYLPPGFQLAHYEEVVRRFPLRRREADLAKPNPVGLPDECTQVLGKLFAGAVEGALSRSTSFSSAVGTPTGESQSKALPIMDIVPLAPAADVASAGQAALPSAALPEPALSAGQEAVAPRALQDVSAEPLSIRGAESGKEGSLESQLQGLRDSLRSPGEDGDIAVGAKKRPASKKARAAERSAGSKKRPAACQLVASGGSAGSKKRPGACAATMKGASSKSKAVACAGSAGSKKQAKACHRDAKPKKQCQKGPKVSSAADKAEYRKLLMASVPPALKKRFAKGCASCRFRPSCCNSCWFKRGFRV